MPNIDDFAGDSIPPSPKLPQNMPTDVSGVSDGENVAFNIAPVLERISYPASKQDIIDYTEDEGADPMVLEMLEELPDTTYNSPTDVSQALGENANLVYG